MLLAPVSIVNWRLIKFPRWWWWCRRW